MTYAVIAPKRINGTVKLTAIAVSDDIDEAKTIAKKTFTTYTNKGFDAWANQVKVKSPKTPDGFYEVAEMVAEYGHSIDWASNGNSFKAQSLIDWANILRTRAIQLADPELCAS
jgi:hypothetical protein